MATQSVRPLAAQRQGLQKFMIVCLDSAGKTLGEIHGGETLELVFEAGSPCAHIWANGELLTTSSQLVPPGTAKMVIVPEAGRGGW